MIYCKPVFWRIWKCIGCMLIAEQFLELSLYCLFMHFWICRKSRRRLWSSWGRAWPSKPTQCQASTTRRHNPAYMMTSCRFRSSNSSSALFFYKTIAFLFFACWQELQLTLVSVRAIFLLSVLANSAREVVFAFCLVNSLVVLTVMLL